MYKHGIIFIIFNFTGLKSDDPQSRAYIPSVFSFISSPLKKKASHDLLRYKAMKRREQHKAELEQDEMKNLTESHAECMQPTNTVSIGTQTDLTMNDIAALEEDYQCRIDEPANQKKVQKGYPSVDDFSRSEKILHFYTGISSFTVLMAIFNLVSAGIPDKGICKLSKFEYFTLVLMKLRLHASNCDLAFRFGISESTVSRIFVKWIETMDIRLSFLITWPDREALQRTMPFCFRPNYGLKVTSIIDCFELFIEKPSDLFAKSCTWSQYKHYNTAKYLISITPLGVISFISNGWGGRLLISTLLKILVI